MSGNYWEERYRAGDTSWDKGEPSPGLVDFLAQHPVLERGVVAVPGCGMGHDVRAFARAGFTALGYDIAPTAIVRAREQTASAGLTAGFCQVDFLHAEPPQKFDWLFEHTLFCAIQMEERDDYVRAVKRWVKPGGNYLAVNYLVPPDRPGPPFTTTVEEQKERFMPGFELRAEWTPRSYPNRAGLERMFWWVRRRDAIA